MKKQRKTEYIKQNLFSVFLFQENRTQNRENRKQNLFSVFLFKENRIQNEENRNPRFFYSDRKLKNVIPYEYHHVINTDARPVSVFVTLS